MVKELQKRFIKTTMLVVTIMLVVFLTSMNIINYSLMKRDNESKLDKIVTRSLRLVPGIQAMNMNRPGQNNEINSSSGIGDMSDPMAEPEIPGGPAEPMSEPEIPGGPEAPMTEPDIPNALMESMTEFVSGSEPPEAEREDLGRYVVARLNSNGAIVFKDLVHDPDLQFSELVNLINAADVEFAPKATGETETEENSPLEINPGTNITTAGGSASEEGIKEGNDTSSGAPPANGDRGASVNESGIMPSEENGVSPSGENGASPSGENGAGPSVQNAAGNVPSDEGNTAPKEARGIVNGYMYYAAQQADQSVVYVFMNVSEQAETVIRILLLTGALGIALWILIFLVVVFLSKKAIAPIAENIEKQRQFITDAGHEIKTPLAVIVSNVDVQELHSGKTKWLDNIRAQALRLSDLTKQMLTLSKMEEIGSTSFIAMTFDASKELEEMVRIFRESASLRDIDIQTDIEQGVQIHFPKDQYRQMTELLLDNAMKYGKEHGFLAVSLHNERKTITLSFKNDCDKLPDIDPDRLFERFYRSDSSRSRQTGGSGIGLAVVRAIAEHDGGYAKAHFLPNEVIEFEIQLQKRN